MKSGRKLWIGSIRNKLETLLSKVVSRKEVFGRTGDVQNIFQPDYGCFAILTKDMEIAFTNAGSGHGNAGLRNSNSEVNRTYRTRNKVSEIPRYMTIRAAVITSSEMCTRGVPCCH